eukprot:TRINITY_DN81694_c0_g1_i1.p1 TRINITY_DN81694_c0_g1~~TRINITY_DN81694_c0_g1_i1.p1  ORF type:complete len:423 (+),score=64.43 TRINITY_DN81694_c0_g1_i1:79-1269(+)
MRGKVLELERTCSPKLVGKALAQLWTIDGGRLVSRAEGVEASVKCPITMMPLTEPVLLCDGVIYEKSAILQWINRSGRSPCTNLDLQHGFMLQLEDYREVVEQFLQSDEFIGSSFFNALDSRIYDVGQAGTNTGIPTASLHRHIQNLEHKLHQDLQYLGKLQEMCTVSRSAVERLSAELTCRKEQAAKTLQSYARSFLSRRRKLYCQSTLLLQAKARTFCSQKLLVQLWKPRLSAARRIATWWKRLSTARKKPRGAGNPPRASKKKPPPAMTYVDDPAFAKTKALVEKHFRPSPGPTGTFLDCNPFHEMTGDNKLLQACKARELAKELVRKRGRIPRVEKIDIDLVVQSSGCTRKDANLSLTRFNNSIMDATIDRCRAMSGQAGPGPWNVEITAWH